MPLEQTEENLKKGYCATIACTAIGAAVGDCTAIFPEIVWKVVPKEVQDSYPARLLACATQVCTREPYGWAVDQTTPAIGDTTTFESLYEGWFKQIIS